MKGVTLHGAFAILFTLATGVIMFKFFPDGSTNLKFAQLAQYLFGTSGIIAAYNFQTPGDKAILKAAKSEDAGPVAVEAEKHVVDVPPVAAFLPFLLLGVLSLSACAAVQAWAKCELNALPQTTQSVVACVAGAAMAPQGTDQQGVITSCVVGLLPGQASCLVEGYAGWLKGTIPQHGQATSATVLGITRLEIWLAAHPAAACCAPGAGAPSQNS